jgi:putative SOS response-associated peptidase YedK
MCNLYETPPAEIITDLFGTQILTELYEKRVAPLKRAPIIRKKGKAEIAQWGIIPAHSKSRKPTTHEGKPMSTNNARIERVATAPTYRKLWTEGQRCLIPAQTYDEPYWGTGKNIWWRFARADGLPWALGGIWGEWKDFETGELVLSYSMLTQNCDHHPLLKHMHKPDPKFAPDKQDKRAVVPIEQGDWDKWLTGTVEDALSLIRLPAVTMFKHGAADPGKQVELPIAA